MKRVPEPERRAFFDQISESYRRHKGGERPSGLRERIVARGQHGAFRLLERGAAARRALRRTPRALAGRLRRRLRRPRPDELDRYYRARLREPVDPNLAAFAAYWYPAYSCNPRAIYEKAREFAPEIRGVWVVKRRAPRQGARRASSSSSRARRSTSTSWRGPTTS